MCVYTFFPKHVSTVKGPKKSVHASLSKGSGPTVQPLATSALTNTGPKKSKPKKTIQNRGLRVLNQNPYK